MSTGTPSAKLLVVTLLVLAVLAHAAPAAHAGARGNGAVFVAQTPPPLTMQPGGTAVVSITVRNSGTSTWTAAKGYGLGPQEPADNDLWRRGRVRLAAGETIRPGERKTFRFTVTAPTRSGKHPFRWRMVRERVEWFGHATPKVAVQVAGPVVAGCVNGTLSDPRAYLFSLIGRAEGSSATDWAEVLTRSGLPAGSRAGVRPPPDAPSFGLTQQIDSSGNVRGRIFLPTAAPDDYGYYLHAIDVLEGQPLRWGWKDWLGGPPYAPRPCP